MDTRFLESLLAVVESGSIAGAARQQGLTSAAVSQRIIALEKELGCELLSRVSHAAKPTDTCLNILKRARKIVREAEDLRSDVQSGVLAGNLHIGAISTALTGILPQALKTLSEIAPHILPIITPGTSKKLYEAVKSEQLDAAILVDPPFKIPKYFTKYIIQHEPLVLISKEKCTASIKEMLLHERYIAYDSQSWGGRLANAFLSDNKIKTKLYCELDALETICIMVSQGIGISLVPHWARIEQYADKLSIFPIDDETYVRSVVLIVSAQTNRPKVIQKLKEALRVDALRDR